MLSLPLYRSALIQIHESFSGLITLHLPRDLLTDDLSCIFTYNRQSFALIALGLGRRHNHHHRSEVE